METERGRRPGRCAAAEVDGKVVGTAGVDGIAANPAELREELSQIGEKIRQQHQT